MDNTFLLVAVILYITMIYLRYKTGARIYNLFAVGILLYLAIQFISALPMVITFTGLIIYQLYDTWRD